MKPYINKKSKTLYLNRVLNHHLISQVNPLLDTQECNIFMTVIPKELIDNIEQFNKYKKAKDINSCVSMNEALLEKYPFYYDEILMYGDANEQYKSYGNFEGLLDRIVKRDSRGDRLDNAKEETIFYRNYEKRQESWENDCVYMNPCPDFKMSWQSALRALGFRNIKGLRNDFKPAYVVIWFNTKPINNVINDYNL